MERDGEIDSKAERKRKGTILFSIYLNKNILLFFLISILQVRRFAELHNRVNLIKMTEVYIQDKFMEIVQSDTFLSMPDHILHSLVSSPDLNVENEKIVYQAVMRWIKSDEANRQIHLPNLFTKVINLSL